MRAKKKLVVFTGAGMSAESGIPTFRGSDGLWEGHRVEDVATPEAFERNPELVYEFYNERRRNIFQAEPNAGHLALVAAERDWDIEVITQNVDNLHERAGSKRVLHLHGRIDQARSMEGPELIVDIEGDLNMGSLLPDGRRLRPHIVWFGELVPAITEAQKIVRGAEAMLVVGSSLQVYPAAGLVYELPMGRPLVLVDPGKVGNVRVGFHHVQKGGSEGIPEGLEYLRGILEGAG